MSTVIDTSDKQQLAGVVNEHPIDRYAQVVVFFCTLLVIAVLIYTMRCPSNVDTVSRERILQQHTSGAYIPTASYVPTVVYADSIYVSVDNSNFRNVVVFEPIKNGYKAHDTVISKLPYPMYVSELAIMPMRLENSVYTVALYLDDKMVWQKSGVLDVADYTTVPISKAPPIHDTNNTYQQLQRVGSTNDLLVRNDYMLSTILSEDHEQYVGSGDVVSV